MDRTETSVLLRDLWLKTNTTHPYIDGRPCMMMNTRPALPGEETKMGEHRGRGSRMKLPKGCLEYSWDMFSSATKERQMEIMQQRTAFAKKVFEEDFGYEVHYGHSFRRNYGIGGGDDIPTIIMRFVAPTGAEEPQLIMALNKLAELHGLKKIGHKV
tara:strand:- start:134 stop:604 length:471 start_codon:yes stop_codon:yes gene_type:complete